ncbi:MAG: HEAT repeat domain-containing protein [Planctomycetes bacterium]|nr:HEAT repeat domain-containing protein [Planctomycetota bacterium]
MARIGLRVLLAAAVVALALGCASQEDQDHPKENAKPIGDREPIDYRQVDFADGAERVVFFADLDRHLKHWSGAKSAADHAVAEAMELAVEEMVRGNFSALVRILQEGQPNERRIAAMALGFGRDSRALSPLIEATRDADPDVRIHALQSIGVLHDPETPVEPVLACMEDPDPGVRAAACFCLGGIVPPKSDKGALVPLLKATQDPDARVRAHAVVSLGFLGNHMATKTVVSNSLFDENWLVRRNACAALGRIKDQRAVVPLVERLDDENEEVRLMAEEALHQITDQDYGRNKRAWQEWAAKNTAELE